MEKDEGPAAGGLRILSNHLSARRDMLVQAENSYKAPGQPRDAK